MEYRGSYPGNAYSGHENYVEVSVTGSIMYPLESLSFEEYFPGYVTTILTACVTIGAFIKYIRSGQFPGPWGWLIALVCAIASGAAFYGMIYYLPVGLTFNDGDMTAQTTNNPITVQVTRHKKSSNLSLWNFQYGNIKAKSAGHAFPENEDITIEPVFLEDLSSIASNVSEIPSAVFNLATITSIARQMMCMGLSFATGYLISSFFGIVSLWVAIGLILYYVIIGDLCEEATEDFVIDEDDATYNGINDNTDEWFNTRLHLFETELVSGFLQ
jgi:hypothetical protein